MVCSFYDWFLIRYIGSLSLQCQLGAQSFINTDCCFFLLQFYEEFSYPWTLRTLDFPAAAASPRNSINYNPFKTKTVVNMQLPELHLSHDLRSASSREILIS